MGLPFLKVPITIALNKINQKHFNVMEIKELKLIFTLSNLNNIANVNKKKAKIHREKIKLFARLFTSTRKSRY